MKFMLIVIITMGAMGHDPKTIEMLRLIITQLKVGKIYKVTISSFLVLDKTYLMEVSCPIKLERLNVTSVIKVSKTDFQIFVKGSNFNWQSKTFLDTEVEAKKMITKVTSLRTPTTFRRERPDYKR